MKKSEAICIVAHPDDETIWMGGTILTHFFWDWIIFCLCRKGDLDREPKFFRACDIYGAKGIILDLDDEILEPLDNEEVVNKIINNLPKRNFDFVFTHGVNGEYGHIRHKEINLAVRNIVNSGKIKCGEVKFFSYNNGVCEGGDYVNVLSDDIFKKKREIIKRAYGFSEDSFEVKCSGKQEAFAL